MLPCHGEIKLIKNASQFAFRLGINIYIVLFMLGVRL